MPERDESEPSFLSDDPGRDWRGRIGRTLGESRPWWRPRPVPASDAPSVIVILLDDLGFSDLACFGGEIATPEIDALAAGGLRFTEYTTVPMCTPARAALLTGKNPHAVGCGWLTSADPGYPGYAAGEITRDVFTIPELLREAGYSTYAAGKWHNTPDLDTASSGSRASWPLQRGFDRFYGFVGGESSYFLPGHLVRDNQFVDFDEYPDGYYITDDITDQAVGFLQTHVSENPDKPFFLYLPYNAPHTPLHARADDLAEVAGAYDLGWDLVRAARFERQRGLGIAEASWRLPPNPNEMPHWDDVDERTRALYARYMELYAGVVRGVDRNVGKLREALRRVGRLDNTLLILTSDNGANAVGGETGSPSVFDSRSSRGKDVTVATEVMQRDTLASADAWPVYPIGWANVSNAPFRYYKRTPMNGGIRVPFILHWPARIRDGGSLRRQWIHVTDTLPTLVDLLGLKIPPQRAGYRTRRPDGISFAAAIDDPDATVPRQAQHYEMEGNRAFRRSRHKIVSLQPPGREIDLGNWMLFDLEADPTEIDDLARIRPDILRTLAEAFERDAEANYVYPLDNRGARRALGIPPHREALVNTPRDFFPGSPTIAREIVSPLIADRDFVLRARFDFSAGDRGTIVAVGERFAGFALVVDADALEFHYVSWPQPRSPVKARLAAGSVTVVLRHTALGRLRGLGELSVNDMLVQRDIDMSPTIVKLGSEGLDIGIDRRQPLLTPARQPGGFRYTNRIERVRIEAGRQAPGSPANRREFEARHQ